jgi:hypothetical protein
VDSLSQAVNPYPSVLSEDAVFGSGEQAIYVPHLFHAVIVNSSHAPWASRRHHQITDHHILNGLDSINHLHLSQ